MAFRDLAILSLVLILAIGTPSYAAPYLDSPSAIPGKIEAENYDTGGEGEGRFGRGAGDSPAGGDETAFSRLSFGKQQSMYG